MPTSALSVHPGLRWEALRTAAQRPHQLREARASGAIEGDIYAAQRQGRELPSQRQRPCCRGIQSSQATIKGSMSLRLHSLLDREADAATASIGGPGLGCGGVQACDHLERQHSEGVSLASFGETPRARIDRTFVAWRAGCHLHVHMRGVGLTQDATQAEVGHLGRPMAIEENVCGLDVTVERLWCRAVHVRKTGRCVQANAEPLMPMEGPPVWLSAAVQATEDVTACQELVDEVSE
mmetsp:Transcript_58342/g.125348  ORF Transcript_58342/g.125348 Transcript_58342/m.125348 type:complete len:237 (-) Transcript_58342:432-1142(-)